MEDNQKKDGKELTEEEWKEHWANCGKSTHLKMLDELHKSARDHGKKR